MRLLICSLMQNLELFATSTREIFHPPSAISHPSIISRDCPFSLKCIELRHSTSHLKRVTYRVVLSPWHVFARLITPYCWDHYRYNAVL